MNERLSTIGVDSYKISTAGTDMIKVVFFDAAYINCLFIIVLGIVGNKSLKIYPIMSDC